MPGTCERMLVELGTTPENRFSLGWGALTPGAKLSTEAWIPFEKKERKPGVTSPMAAAAAATASSSRAK